VPWASRLAAPAADLDLSMTSFTTGATAKRPPPVALQDAGFAWLACSGLARTQLQAVKF